VKPKRFFYILLGVICVLVALSAGGYFLALTALNSEAANESAKMALQNQDYTTIATMHKVARQYNQIILPILPLMDEALPTDKKQSEILAQLQNIASSVGLQISSVSMPSPVGLPSQVSQTVKAGNVLELPINFQLSGTYQQLQSFTEQVEDLNRFTDITNLTVDHPSSTEPIVYTISLVAYVLP
jgi:Tfp pilus assembly protein PilO